MERDAIEDHIADHRRQRLGVGGVGQLQRRVQQVEHTLRCADGRLELAVEVSHDGHGRGDENGVDEIGDEVTGGQAAEDDLRTAVVEDAGDGD